ALAPRGRGRPHDGPAQHDVAGRAQEGRVPEGEDATVAARQPVSARAARAHPAHAAVVAVGEEEPSGSVQRHRDGVVELGQGGRPPVATETFGPVARGGGDRKSTRLNSSHLVISYAV